ncbi:MAG: pyridoxine 5'-phosphate synthase, partial [Gammaproteobacteria bacterium]|nr:pyridoxine 5'-phosphate synthase [Gammaproteobacteria bacterium]
NAGHDLNQDNLARFCHEVPNVAEVSIGHAIITDALSIGLSETVSRYREILNSIA